MAVYNIKRTLKSAPPIQIQEEEIDQSTALTLFGRKRLAYGQELNENLLTLLESFACPPVDPNATTQIPDQNAASGNQFETPVVGQLWYNSHPSHRRLYVFDGSGWLPQSKSGDIAANWGVMLDGGQLPLPVSPTGRTFSYSECGWVVSPFGYPNVIDYMICKTDGNAVVQMQYSLESSPDLVAGYVNYLIVGIPGNINRGSGDSLPVSTAKVEVNHNVEPMTVTLTQGDGSIYSLGLSMTATDCSSVCVGNSSFAPLTTPSGALAVTVSGGSAPYNVTITDWEVESGSPNNMFNEWFRPDSKAITGEMVGGNPLTAPEWNLTVANSGDTFTVSTIGACGEDRRVVVGTANIHITDKVGNTKTIPFGWSYVRDVAEGTHCN